MRHRIKLAKNIQGIYQVLFNKKDGARYFISRTTFPASSSNAMTLPSHHVRMCFTCIIKDSKKLLGGYREPGWCRFYCTLQIELLQ